MTGFELLEKTKKVAQNEAAFETLEELAFGTGQVISYLIEITPKNPEKNTYGILDRFLPTTGKLKQVQDAIARYMSTQIPNCTINPGGRFETLASQVMINDMEEQEITLTVKRYIFAGLFSPNVLLD